MSSESSFADLIARLRAGDNSAAAETFVRFSQRLMERAREHLHPAVLSRVDPEDVIQSVYRSFFGHLRDGEFRFDGWGGIQALLVEMTLRKCTRDNRFHLALRRDATRTIVPDVSTPDSVQCWEAIARDASPLEGMIMAETVEGLMQRLTDPQHRRILQMRLQGYRDLEISNEVQVSERTVERVLKRVRGWMEADAAQIRP